MTSLIQETKETISYLETVETALGPSKPFLKSPRFEKSWSKTVLSNDATEKDPQTQKPEKYLASTENHYLGLAETIFKTKNWPLRWLRKMNSGSTPRIFQAVTWLHYNLNPSDEVKADAAELAAYFSKGRL